MGAHVHQGVIPPPPHKSLPPPSQNVEIPPPLCHFSPPLRQKNLRAMSHHCSIFFLIGSDLARLVSNILHCVLDSQMLFINKPFSLLSLEWPALLTIV